MDVQSNLNLRRAYARKRVVVMNHPVAVDSRADSRKRGAYSKPLCDWKGKLKRTAIRAYNALLSICVKLRSVAQSRIFWSFKLSLVSRWSAKAGESLKDLIGESEDDWKTTPYCKGVVWRTHAEKSIHIQL